MTRIELQQATTRLATYYGSQPPSADRLAELWPLVEHLPGGEPLAWMVRHIQEQEESMPRNLARALRAAWEAWQRAHPQQVAQDTAAPAGCADCRQGWLWVWRPSRTDPTYPVTSVFACRRCRPGYDGAIPASTLAELQAHGWELRPEESIARAYRPRRAV